MATRTALPRALRVTAPARSFSSTSSTLAGAEPSSSSSSSPSSSRRRDGGGPPRGDNRRGGGGGRPSRNGGSSSDPRGKLGLLSPVPTRTSFADARLLNPSPSLPFSGVQAPLPSSAAEAPRTSAGGVLPVGPGNHALPSLRYAERGLHFHLDGRGPGEAIGQNGTMYGVRFPKERVERIRAQSAGGKELAQAVREVQREEYLERVGGDYSRYVPSPSQGQAQGQQGWKDTVRRALAPQSRANVTPLVVERFSERVDAIIKGESFGAVVPQEGKKEKKKKEVVEPEKPAAPAKGKGGKRK